MTSTDDNSDGTFDLHLSNSHHRIDVGKNPFQLGYIHVLIKYRPAAVEKFLEWAHQNYGDVIKYHWKSSVISIGNHEIATQLLKHPNFQRKGTFTETVTILNPFSMVSISGPEWTRAHWLMVRAIGRISIHNMCCHVRSAVQRLVCSPPLLVGHQVDLYDFTKKVTLEAMISEVFGSGIRDGECHIIHAGIEAIIGELQGLTQTSSQYRVNRQRLDALVDAKIEFEYLSVIHSTRFHNDSLSLSSTFPPRLFPTVATDDSQFDSKCHFLRALVEHNASNNRSPSKASQTPLSLIQLRDLVINVLLFMGTINPAEACVHAIIEIFRSKWSVEQRHLWIETEELIRNPDSLDREAGFNRILRESLRMFPPVAGLSFNRRATADTVIHGWRFRKDDNIICSPYVFHHSPNIWEKPQLFQPDRFLHLNSIQSASFMPFSVGARSCPGLKIGYSVAETLLKEMTVNIDVFVPSNYVHTRSLRGGAGFYVRKSSEQSDTESSESLTFVRQAQANLSLAQTYWPKFRDLSVNFELACSQLLPKRFVVSFYHQSKFLSLIIAGVQVASIILLVQMIIHHVIPTC